ncbi:MAG: Phenylalanine--tRNA ligase beta subunit [Acidimicrobiales bacterium]|nr:MAG: phenylalanine--tRNA ligase subunit beta [Actinomycetota bacterium]MBV6507104.1 Phenylalanine--tRNA ligase beta subunit [Acidimicrobiales bacterium]RIK05593.1 MAG: phenylalanine--tRNA ligase subunit beta [Acidobacteriota bacterium]
MKVLLSWLREFAPFEGDPVDLGEQLSDLGLAVEQIETLGAGLDGVIAARVMALRPHPNADKIQLVDLDVGDGEVTQVCCGAFNMQIGDLVPLATAGTTMPGGLEIARRKLRGEWSDGMLCSAVELGLGDDASGIMILSEAAEAGTALREVLGLDADILFDLEVNANRPDAMSVAGVARDLAARMGVPFALPGLEVATVEPESSALCSAEIIDRDLCGRFFLRVMSGIEVGASPPWLARRLISLGMRPINSVVDVSNYVMLELGQPNHTYDLAKLPDGALLVRWARAGESIVTLDGELRVLTADDGVIANARHEAVGIAGVMGGASTEISEETNDIVVEMAWWDPMSIARTSKRLNLRSEASARFERGSDPEIADYAMLRFAELLAGSGGELHAGAVDERGELPPRDRVKVRTARVNALLGTALTAEAIDGYLAPIGFTTTPAGDGLEVTVPTFRPDTTSEIDIIEEIARHHGYSNIERSVPLSGRTGHLTRRQRQLRLLRSVLVGFGLAEAMPVPFLAPGDLDRCGLADDGVRIANPLVAEESVLRTSHLPGLLKAIAYNESHRNEGVELFEIGQVFGLPRDAEQLPDERSRLAVALAGSDARRAADLWRGVAAALAVPDSLIDAGEVSGMHPTRSAAIAIGTAQIGFVGEVDPDVLAAFEISQRVGYLELDVDELLSSADRNRSYRPISRYPSSDIDLAFVVDEEVPAAAVAAAIAKAGGDLLVKLQLFDVYRGDRLGAGRRSLAYALRFQAPDHTLTDAEVAQARKRCIEAVERDCSATLRT